MKTILKKELEKRIILIKGYCSDINHYGEMENYFFKCYDENDERIYPRFDDKILEEIEEYFSEIFLDERFNPEIY